LTEHLVKCEDYEALTGFRLNQVSDTSLNYVYKCVKSDFILNELTIYQTEFNSISDYRNHSANFLDRHNVTCPSGTALKGFQLIRNDEDQIAYLYSCVSFKSKYCGQGVTEESIGSAEDGSASIIYLDRQQIDLDENQVLTDFKLNARYTGVTSVPHYTYSYNYCSLPSG